MIRDEIVLQIGQLIMQAANDTTPDWAYAGYVYQTTDGRNSSRQDFLFGSDLARAFIEDDAVENNFRVLFPRLWEVATDDDENHFVAVKAAVRASDRELKVLFEFEDTNRWAVGPGNVRQAVRIYLGDVFPDAVE